jgi:hypothetical protein
MTNKHTPAPWGIDGFDILNGYFHIAKVTVHSHEMSKANAKLMSAAPDLLEALIDAFELIAGDSDVSHFDTIDKMKYAIAKATGEN